jgi:hypothetical protein
VPLANRRFCSGHNISHYSARTFTKEEGNLLEWLKDKFQKTPRINTGRLLIQQDSSHLPLEMNSSYSPLNDLRDVNNVPERKLKK